MFGGPNTLNRVFLEIFCNTFLVSIFMSTLGSRNPFRFLTSQLQPFRSTKRSFIHFCPRKERWYALSLVYEREQQNLFPTVAKKPSPLFIRISHFLSCCVSDGNARDNSLGRFSLWLVHLAAAQHFDQFMVQPKLAVSLPAREGLMWT